MKTRIVDRLSSPMSVNYSDRKHLMDNIQRLEFKRYIQSAELITNLLPDESKEDQDFLFMILLRRRQLMQAICGPRFIEIPCGIPVIPVENPITCVRDAEALCLNFKTHYIFKTAQKLQDVICELGFSQSNQVTDIGIRFPIGKRMYVTGSVAFMVYVRRLCLKESDLGNLGIPFGKRADEVSRIVSAVARYLYNTYTVKSFRLEVMAERFADMLPIFNRAIIDRYNSYYLQRWEEQPVVCPREIRDTAFMTDGTVFRVSRLAEKRGDPQRAVYNAKHGHCFDVLVFYAPDGRVTAVHGPCVGTNDLGMMLKANAVQHLAGLGRFKVLGDSIFHDSANMVHIPDTAESLLRDIREVKTAQGVRGEIEHGFVFKDLLAFFSNRKKLKVNTLPCMHVLNAFFLQNILTCLHGNQSSFAFGLNPPDFRDYIAEQKQYNQ